MKSSVYTGIAYLLTVALLVLPYLLLPAAAWLASLGILLATVVLIIAGFTYLRLGGAGALLPPPVWGDGGNQSGSCGDLLCHRPVGQAVFGD